MSQSNVGINKGELGLVVDVLSFVGELISENEIIRNKLIHYSDSLYYY